MCDAPSTFRRLSTVFVRVAGGLLTSAVLASYAARLGWPWELLTHFRLQYALGFVLLAVVALAVRRWRLGAACVLLACGQAWPVWEVGTRQTLKPGGRPPVRLATANVWLGNRTPQAVAAYLRRVDPDVIVLTEVGRFRELLERELADWPQVVFEAHPTPYDIMLLSKQPLHDVVTDRVGDWGTPVIEAVIGTSGGRLRVVAAHPANPVRPASMRQRDRQIADLARRAAASAEPVVVLGDMNVTRYSPVLRDALAAGRLREARPPGTVAASWPRQLPPGLRLPIDHILVGRGVRVHSLTVGPDVGADHFPLVAEVSRCAP